MTPEEIKKKRLKATGDDSRHLSHWQEAHKGLLEMVGNIERRKVLARVLGVQFDAD